MTARDYVRGKAVQRQILAVLADGPLVLHYLGRAMVRDYGYEGGSIRPTLLAMERAGEVVVDDYHGRVTVSLPARAEVAS